MRCSLNNELTLLKDSNPNTLRHKREFSILFEENMLLGCPILPKFSHHQWIPTNRKALVTRGWGVATMLWRRVSVISALYRITFVCDFFCWRFKRCVGFGFHLVVGFFLLDVKAVNWQRHDGRVVLQNERFKSISLVWYKVFISSITKNSKIRYFLLIFFDKKFFSPKIQWHQRLNNTGFFYQFNS